MVDSVERYRGLAEPNRSRHLWRYTGWKRVHPTGSLAEVPPAENPMISLLSLDGSPSPSGVELRQASEEDFSRLVGDVLPEDEVMSSFLRAISAGRAHVLHVPAGWVGDSSLLIELVATGEFSIQHLLLDVGRVAEVDIALTVRGDAGWFGLLQEGSIGEGAIVRALFNNSLSSSSRLARSEGLSLSRDASFHAATLSLGAGRAKTDLRYELMGPGSDLSVHLAVHGKEDRHDDHHVEISHPVGKNQSRLVMHAACDDNSRSIGTGCLTIAEGAQQTDAGQVFRNLLLSEKAKADAIPELEVLADDVAAAHGAATAPLDKDQMFYLESRGLDKESASDLIVEGFLMDAFSGFASEELSNYLRTRLLVHLDCALTV